MTRPDYPSKARFTVETHMKRWISKYNQIGSSKSKEFEIGDHLRNSFEHDHSKHPNFANLPDVKLPQSDDLYVKLLFIPFRLA